MGRTVVGVDPSLRATGVCLLAEGEPAYFDSFGRSLMRSASDQLQRERLHYVIMKVLGLVNRQVVDAVAIEGPAFSRFPNERLSEFRGALRYALEKQGLAAVHVVQPSAARKAAFGTTAPALHGAELKRAILGAVRARGANAETHDQADAWAVARWMMLKLGGV